LGLASRRGLRPERKFLFLGLIALDDLSRLPRNVALHNSLAPDAALGAFFASLRATSNGTIRAAAAACCSSSAEIL
jgi:hypothetical protein